MREREVEVREGGQQGQWEGEREGVRGRGSRGQRKSGRQMERERGVREEAAASITV